MGFRALHAFAAALGAAVVSLASPDARAAVDVERGTEASDCPSTAEFVERLRDGTEEVVGVDLAVRFERTPTGYRASIRTADGAERVLSDDGASCEPIAVATALAVKLSLDTEFAYVEAPLAASNPKKVESKAPAVLERKDRTGRVEAFASGVVAFGLTTPVAPGVRLGGGMRLGGGRWSVGISGLVLPAQKQPIGGGSVAISALGGGFEGCGHWPLSGTFEIAFCARTEAFRLAGTATGFARSESHARSMFTGALTSRASVRVGGPVRLGLEGSVVLPFERGRFGIDTLGVAYEPPVVALVTGIGVLVDFE